MAVVLMFFQHRGAARGEWAMFAGVLEPVDMDIPLVFFIAWTVLENLPQKLQVDPPSTTRLFAACLILM